MKIRKCIGVFFILAGFWGAQAARAQIADIGIRAGFDMIPTSSNDQTHGGSLPVGFNVGIHTRLWLLPQLAFEPELQYTWMHYSSHTNTPDAGFVNGIAREFQVPPAQVRQMIGSYSEKTTTTTSYLYLPLLIGYKINTLFMVSAGPEFGFLQGNENDARLEVHLNAPPPVPAIIKSHTRVNSTEGLHKTLVGIDGAVQMHLDTKVSAEVRYTRSLTPLEDGLSDTKSYYNYIQFSLIYTLVSL